MKKVYMATIIPHLETPGAFETLEVSECDFSGEWFDGREDMDVLRDYVGNFLEDSVDESDISEDARGNIIYFRSGFPSGNEECLYVFQDDDPIEMYFVGED